MTEQELKELMKKADNWNLDALVRLGNYFNGLSNTEENQRKAHYYYSEAARLGYAPAEFQVAMNYYNGSGVSIDKSTSIKYIQSAANKGYANAKYVLGMMYKRGELGFLATEKKAFKCFEEAAKLGQINAQIDLGDIYMFEKHEIDNAIFWWACAFLHGETAKKESEEAKVRIEDLVESGVPGGYDRVQSIMDDVKSRYSQYTRSQIWKER